jgi:hypothetical protein
MPSSSESLVLVDVPDDVDANQYRLIARGSISRKDIKDLKTERRRFYLRMSDLVIGTTYSLRMFVRSSGSWEPVSPWWEMMAGADIGRISTEYVTSHLLKALTSATNRQDADAILKFTTHDDQSSVHRNQVARFVFHVWEHCSRSVSRVDSELLGRLAREAAASKNVSEYVCSALDYLVLWAEAERYFRRESLKGFSHHSAASNDQCIDTLRETIARIGYDLGTEYGPLMFEGLIASLRNRTEAKNMFHTARAASPRFSDSLYLDQYVSSYFSSTEIQALEGEIAERRVTLENDFEVLHECWPGGSSGRGDRVILLFSCDPTFFAVYYPYWVSVIDYLRSIGVSLHFTLIGDHDQAVKVVEKGLALTRAVAGVHGSDPATLSSSVSFSRVGVPTYVEEPRTFAACARYLLARTIAARFDQRVVILDMDMIVRSNPQKFLQGLCGATTERFSVVVGGGLPSLIPARRYIANTFAVPGGEMGRQAMQDIEDYLYAGVSQQNSWTLDQNALAYTVERIVARHGSESVLDIGATFERPFVQIPISQLLEGEQRRLEHV